MRYRTARQVSCGGVIIRQQQGRRSEGRQGRAEWPDAHRARHSVPPRRRRLHRNRGGSGFQVCLIARRPPAPPQAWRRTGREGALVWGLPKGHVEPGETLPATALREVREETGLVGELVRPLGSITYRFAVPEERVRYFKRVHFFLLRYREGDPAHHDDEVEQARWLPLDKALTLLSYANEQKVLRKAQQYLTTFLDR